MTVNLEKVSAVLWTEILRSELSGCHVVIYWEMNNSKQCKVYARTDYGKSLLAKIGV